MTQCEDLLERKEDLNEAKKGKKVLELKNVEKQIENLLEEMKQELIDLDYKSKLGLIDVNVGLEAILCMVK